MEALLNKRELSNPPGIIYYCFLSLVSEIIVDVFLESLSFFNIVISFGNYSKVSLSTSYFYLHSVQLICLVLVDNAFFRHLLQIL